MVRMMIGRKGILNVAELLMNMLVLSDGAQVQVSPAQHACRAYHQQGQQEYHHHNLHQNRHCLILIIICYHYY